LSTKKLRLQMRSEVTEMVWTAPSRASQTIGVVHETSGSLTVRFRAGGAQEMCWHLFTWGATVAIVAPDPT